MLEEHHDKIASIIQLHGHEKEAKLEEKESDRTIRDADDSVERQDGGQRLRVIEDGPSEKASDRRTSSRLSPPAETAQAGKPPPPTQAGNHHEQSSEPSKPSRTSTSPTKKRFSSRDAPSSSIAGNLASARGIPTPPQRGARQSLINARSPSSPTNSLPKRQLITTEWQSTRSEKDSPDADSATQQDEPPPTTDAAFHKFYANLTPLLSKLSAPLAFAGLPLTTSEEQPDTSRRDSENPATDDVSTLFSPSALRALRADHDSTNNPPPPHESFYVVPPGGGTVSYANILSQQKKPLHAIASSKHRRTFSHPDEENDETFEDARETLAVGASRAATSRAGAVRDTASATRGGKTLEELEIENRCLKEVTDGMARRLYMWEKSAQRQASVLKESMRFMAPPTSSSDEREGKNEGEGGGRDHEARVRALEEELKKVRSDSERLGRENDKLRGVVSRYRERWEKLREGAKTRRETAS